MATVLEPRSDLERASTGDDPLHEIVDGQRVDLPSMGIHSNLISNYLFILLYNHVAARRLGTVTTESLFILDDEGNLGRRPDIAYVSAERWPLDRDIPETGDCDVVPDLAIEVTSPHDAYADVIAKVHEYFAHGAREVWIVDPINHVASLYQSPFDSRTLTAEQSLSTPLLPGLSIPVGDVFARRPVAAT